MLRAISFGKTLHKKSDLTSITPLSVYVCLQSVLLPMFEHLLPVLSSPHYTGMVLLRAHSFDYYVLGPESQQTKIQIARKKSNVKSKRNHAGVQVWKAIIVKVQSIIF